MATISITSIPEAQELLERLSKDIVGKRRELEQAEAEKAEIQPAWLTAKEKADEVEKTVKRLEYEIHKARRAVAIINARMALSLTVGDDLPPFVPKRDDFTFDRHYELMAIGPEGSGLYRNAGWGRGLRKHGRSWYLREGDTMRKWLKTAGLFTDGGQPSPPPEGGRWRWLKTEDYLALPAGEEE